AGHVVQDRSLHTLPTGPSSDLQYATAASQDYVASLAMGPTKLVFPLQPGQMPPGPVMVAAHEFLDQLYEETERLLREKEPAIHHLAKALIERDELIGEELEEVFGEIEAQCPQLLRPFERKIISFRSFTPPEKAPVDAWAQPPGPTTTPVEDQPAASVPAWTPPPRGGHDRPAEAAATWRPGGVPVPVEAVSTVFPGQHDTYTS